MPYEDLRSAATRMYLKWNRLRPQLTRRGMTAGFVVAHCTWSRLGGWHYHLHCLMEMQDGMPEGWGETWRAMRAEEVKDGQHVELGFQRKLADAGPAMPGGMEVQGELWEEPQDPVRQCLSYMLADATQGIEAWKLEQCHDAALDDFIENAKGLKWYRLFGNWVKRLEPLDDEKADKKASIAARKEEDGWRVLGTCDQVRALAASGDEAARLACERLLARANRRGILAERLRGFFTRVSVGVAAE